MTENTMNKTSDTTVADLPPAPNGHGASNGTKTDETPQADVAAKSAAADAPSSKKKKKKGHRHNQPAPTGRTEPTAPNDPQESIAQPPAQLIEDPAAEPIEPPAEPIVEPPAASLRLRMKVWTDLTTAKRYLMPSAFMRDVVNGHPVSNVMHAYAMSDDSTKLVTLTAAEWNALPFFHFQEDGPAPRAASRPVDDVAVSYTKTP